MLKKIPSIVFGFLLIFLQSCDDEIQVNAPWKDTTVVYGLLSKADNTHFVKINKAFLGEANATDIAAIRDSSEYNSNITATITETINGSVTDVITLKDTILNNKEGGLFYGPEHTLYYFDKTLDAEATYDLAIAIDGKEEIVRSSTEIIDNFNLSGGIIFGNSAVSVGFKSSNGDYVDQTFSFKSVKAGKAYQLSMNVYYDEFYADGSSEEKSIQWDFENKSSFNTLGGQDLNQTISGEAFYQQLASKISSLAESPGVTKRKFLYFQFKMVVSGDELNTYLEVNSPTSSSVVLDKPQYTNIENGIGIFSTRNTIVSVYEKPLNAESRKELYIGQYTSDLGFCAESGLYACD